MSREANLFPPIPESGSIKFICAWWYLETEAAGAKLEALRDAEWRRSNFKMTGTAWALNAALHAIRDVKNANLHAAKCAGELLFCWHGTKATEVAA
jgi:hypothetical protein